MEVLQRRCKGGCRGVAQVHCPPGFLGSRETIHTRLGVLSEPDPLVFDVGGMGFDENANLLFNNAGRSRIERKPAVLRVQ